MEAIIYLRHAPRGRLLNYLDSSDGINKGAALLQDKVVVEKHRHNVIRLLQRLSDNHYMRADLVDPYRVWLKILNIKPPLPIFN